jgi:hypothetical protein
MMEEEQEFDSTDGDALPSSTPSDRRYAGVRALWMKVIIRAVFDWVTYRDSTKIDKLKYAESAHDWLFEKNVLFNSFENVCRHLDIDPIVIRQHARKMTKDDVAKIEHLERDYEVVKGPVGKLLPMAPPSRVPWAAGRKVYKEQVLSGGF